MNGSFYRAADRGSTIFKLVRGREPNFTESGFAPLATFDGVRAGQSVVVAMDDPANFGSDIRTVALVYDDVNLISQSPQEEGTTKSYPVDRVAGNRLTVWVDKSGVDARVNVMSREDALKTVENSDVGALEELGNTLEKQAEKQRQQANRILIGVAAVIVIVVVAAAYALPRVKIPAVKVA